MKFKEKASSLALCVVLLGTTLTPVSAVTHKSIIGENRYETAAKIADNLGNYDTAILVNADKTLADGLSASSLAGKENAPILLVKRDSIPAVTLQRLRNVRKVYIIGGKVAISSSVENKLAGKRITRIEGSNRIETSQNVAKYLGNYSEAFIVNGNKGEADAMSVASVAARDKAPIILTNGKTSNDVRKSGVKYFVVGGEAVVSNLLVNKFGAIRLSGSDRYKTNRAVVKAFYPNSDTLYFTKGNPLVDALTVSSLAKDKGVVLVAPKSDNSILKGKNTVQVGGMKFSIDIGYTKPVITTSVNRLEFNVGDSLDLSRFNIKAVDSDGRDITDRVMITQLPDMSKPGIYELRLEVKDSNGLECTKVLTVVVNENTQKPNPNPDENTQKPSPQVSVNSAAYQAEFNEELFKLVNEHRVANNLSGYFADSKLEQLAFLKSNHMGDLNYFAHRYDDSKTQYYKDKWKNNYPKLLIEQIYPSVANCRTVGENIFYIGTTTMSAKDVARTAFDWWKNSSGHNAAMLYDDCTLAGYGVYAANGNTYVTAKFGK